MDAKAMADELVRLGFINEGTIARRDIRDGLTFYTLLVPANDIINAITTAVKQARAEERVRCEKVVRDFAQELREIADELAAFGNNRKAQRTNRDANIADTIANRIMTGNTI